jgi:Ca2+-transporting ATPase
MVIWHALSKKEVLEEVGSSEKGISDKEAVKRLQKYGKNELKRDGMLNPFIILLQQFKSVFIYILLAAGLFSLFIGHYVDFVVILIIMLVNGAIGFFQQYKAERTIAEMRHMLVPKVKVLRQGIMKEVISSELVVGDILIVSEGDKIMADCRLIESNEIQANESALTGESFPVKKISEKMQKDLELAERKNILYMGTVIVRGNGKAVVIGTGMNSEFGKIAGLVQTFKPVKTPLEDKFDKFSFKVGIAVLFLALITILIGFFRGEEFFDMVLTGIALAVSVIPEGLPAVVAITLALAIRRMHGKNALIRKLPAAETLGRTTVICVDKTGTLTEEEMTVTDIYCGKKIIEIKNNDFYYDGKKIEEHKNLDLIMLLKIGIMCNNARIEKQDHHVNVFGDSTERALIISADKAELFKKEETEKEVRVQEYAFSSKRKMMTIIRENHKGILISYVKGAPGVILERCNKELVNGRVVAMNASRRKELIGIIHELESGALRVLGFAYKNLDGRTSQEAAENNLIFVGFQGMLDPPRKEVRGAIKECLNAGIQIKMITGDSLITAEAVSEMIGLDGDSIEARELEKLSESDFVKVVREKTVFARITPELKFRIVQSLKKSGEIVAVTGDGVNDAPALKEAHIGVAMGIRGTDVAREASDIILLDDNFKTIVGAVREGRRVYANLKKSIKFHIAANVHELFLVMFALLIALPLPMLPLAILWINLITDSLPSLSLSVEKEDKNIMKNKPNKEGDLLSGIYSFILLAGLISFIVSISLFMIFYQADLDKARTIATTACVFSELFLVFTCRSDRNIWEIGIFSNKFLTFAVLIAAALQIFAIYFSPLANIFGFVPLSAGELALAIFSSSAAFVFFEGVKVVKNMGKK